MKSKGATHVGRFFCAVNDEVATAQALERYGEVDVSFGGSREEVLLKVRPHSGH